MANPRGSNRKSRPSRDDEGGSNQMMIGILGGGGIAAIIGFIVVLVMRSGGESPPAVPAPAVVAQPVVATPTVVAMPTVPVQPLGANPSAMMAHMAPPAPGGSATPSGVAMLPSTTAHMAPGGRNSSPPGNALLSQAPTSTPTETTKREALSYPDLVEQTDRSVVRINVKSPRGDSIGSGFVVSDTGVVITNYHVIEGGQTVKVEFKDGRECDVTGFKLFDHERDIAIIQLDPAGKPFIPVQLAQGLPRKGEEVAAFGAPLGLSFTASKGTVSSVRDGRELQMKGNYLQTDTPISPGNSGGPLVSMTGEVVGMNSFQLASGQNLNFAVSAVDIREVLAASENKSVQAITPTSVPAKDRGRGREPSQGLVDITGTERADKLLAQMTESFVMVKGFEIDPSGRINDFLVEKLKKTLKSRLKMDLTRIQELPKDQPVIVMGVMAGNPDDEKIEGRAIEISLEMYVIMIDVDKDGKHSLCVVWREKAKLANLSVKAMVQGSLPRSVTEGSQKFFDKFVNNVNKARKAHGGSN